MRNNETNTKHAITKPEKRDLGILVQIHPSLGFPPRAFPFLSFPFHILQKKGQLMKAFVIVVVSLSFFFPPLLSKTLAVVNAERKGVRNNSPEAASS
ncbi:hypothetical protein LI328DRAFT_88505 [Trichoderma asperelloides]|nr:hypothetical protein LI328DRAFT_88505 [Trichoderma asperelloides]